MNESNEESKGDASIADRDTGDLGKEDERDDPLPLRVQLSMKEEYVLPETCTVLETPEGSKVYLVGTAHFSKQSCKEVQEVSRFSQQTRHQLAF
jgi:hypothetical protein